MSTNRIDKTTNNKIEVAIGLNIYYALDKEIKEK